MELAEAIEAVREQLIKAQDAGRTSGAADNVVFEVGTVSVEFTGEVTRTVGASGGIKFWVVNSEAKGERASGTTQKVTIELTPQYPDGESYRVNDDVNAPPVR